MGKNANQIQYRYMYFLFRRSSPVGGGKELVGWLFTFYRKKKEEEEKADSNDNNN